MKKFKMISRAGFAIGLLLSSAWGPFCNTVELCQNNSCACTVSADGAYGRYYYVDFPNIKKGNVYQLSFALASNWIILKLNDSTFPQGIDTHFPETTTFTIDAKAMVKDIDHIKIKYYVPPSDTPAEIVASIRLVTE